MLRVLKRLAAVLAVVILSPTVWAGDMLHSAAARRDVNPLTGDPLFVPAGYSPCCPPSAGPWTAHADCSAAEECGCADQDCAGCQPACWYVEADMIWLQRERADHFPISFFGSNVPPSLSTDDLEFDFEPGVRLTLGHYCGCDRSLEVSYLGVHDWDESAQLIDPTRNLDPFLRVGIPNIAQFRNAFMHTISASTELDSVEINARRWFGRPNDVRGSFLAGFRYIRVDDDFDFLSNDSDPAVNDDIGLYSVRARNDLVGGQIGGTIDCRVFDRLSLGLKAKGGLFVNFAEQESRLLNVDPPAAPTTDRGSQADNGVLAGLIETGVVATYHITPNFGVRAGYDVFVISGLALAPNQLDFTATFSQPFINDRGTLVLHGPFVGGFLNW